MMMAGDLNDIRKVVADLECEKNNALCENQSLKEELACLEKDLCEHRKIEQKLREDLEETEQTIKCLKFENCKLEECLRNKDCEICNLQKLYPTIDELNACNCQLQKELDCKERQKCALEEQIQDLNRCIQEKDMCIRRLESKLCDLEAALEELEDDNKALCEEHACLKQELDECRNTVEQKQMEIDCLCQRLKKCECEKSKIQCQLQSLHQALEETNEALAKEQACTCKLKEQLKCLQADNHKICMENSCLQEENCELAKKLDASQKCLKKCQCEYERMQSECQACKRSIGEFKKQIVNDLKNAKCCPPDCCPPPCPPCKYPSERSRSIHFPRKNTQRPRRDGDCCDTFSMTSLPRCDVSKSAGGGCPSRLCSTYSGARKERKCGDCPAPQPRCYAGKSPNKKFKSCCKKY